MKRLAVLVAAVFLLGIGTKAQGTQQTPPLSVAPIGQTSAQLAAAAATTPSWLASSSLILGLSGSASPPAASAALESAEPPQGVYGVKPIYPFQGYIGYTFLRFYEVPGTTVNTNGFN